MSNVDATGITGLFLQIVDKPTSLFSSTASRAAHLGAGVLPMRDVDAAARTSSFEWHLHTSPHPVIASVATHLDASPPVADVDAAARTSPLL